MQWFPGGVKVNFSLFVNEKMKWSFTLPFAEFQWVSGFYSDIVQVYDVNPPMIFPNSVSTRVSVFGMLWHFQWNFQAKKSFQEALQKSRTESTFFPLKKASKILVCQNFLMILDVRKMSDVFQFICFKTLVSLRFNSLISLSKPFPIQAIYFSKVYDLNYILVYLFN